MRLESREYKLLVNHELFAEPADAVKALWDEIEEAAKTLPLVRTRGKFDEKETRMILFLDTPSHTLRREGLVLRQRIEEDTVAYTLKCRSEDRYFAAGTDVRTAGDQDAEEKLEEDIAPPFRCRFSHSVTLALTRERKAPKTLREAADLFPVLGTLRVDDRPCPPDTVLAPVHSITVHECIWKGAKLTFEPTHTSEEPEKATLALILWSRAKGGRPAVAELSFRIKQSEKRFGRGLAASAREFYRLLQRLDSARPLGMTKTEYVYRDASRE